MWRRFSFGPLMAGVLAQLALLNSVNAGDWPQILGPQRNGIAEDERLAATWPQSGPKVVWQRGVGDGFSGPAVAGDHLVLFHRIGDQERVEVLSVGSGDKLWQADFSTDYVPSFISDAGPRAVPIIHKGRIYVYGAKGGLRCLDLKTGTKIWQRDTYEDYNSKRTDRGEPPEGYFGIGSTPIVEEDKLIVNVGGDANRAGLVAFDIETGRTVWKSTDTRASYSAPVAATIDGVRHVIFATRLSVVSIDPKNGDVRFRFPFGRTGPTVTAANPVVIDGHLFVSASYGFGAVFARIGATAAESLWQSDEILSSQYTTCIAHKGYLFGIHGRQDAGVASLRCFQPRTQKINWTEEGFGYATLIMADGKLLIPKTNGEIVLAELSPQQFRSLAQARVFPNSSEVRALPALSNGLLFARDQKTLKCLDLRPDDGKAQH